MNKLDQDKRQTKLDKRAAALRDNLKKRKPVRKSGTPDKQEKDS